MFQYSLFLAAILFTNSISGQSHHVYSKLSAKEFHKQLTSSKSVILLDVRTPEEFAKGHIESAINYDINNADFENNLSLLNKKAPIFVYCMAGGRSARASQLMISKGFKNVRELEEGFVNWRANNLPEISANPPSGASMSLALFQNDLIKEGNVLVDFYASWCAPCKKLTPILEKISIENPTIKVIRFDADKNPSLLKSLNINGLPYLIHYRSGVKKWEHKGFISEADLKKELDKH